MTGRGGGIRRVARATSAWAIAWALVVGLAPAATAHAAFVSSDPADGATLAAAPASITMSFTEPPDPDLSSVTVLEASGAVVETGPLQRGEGARSLEFALPGDLADGVYTVSWVVVSEADGHLTPGVFAFGIGVAPGDVQAAPPAASRAAPGPSPLAVAGKTLLYLGLALSVGIAVTALAAFGGAVANRRSLLPVAGIAAIVGAVVMTFAEATVVEASVTDLLSSSAGRAYAWLLAATALTLVAALVASRSTAPVPLVATGLAAAAAMLARATSGHAAALEPAWPAELAQFVHMLAVGIWVGGLLPLLLLVRARARAGTRSGNGALAPVQEARRFSRIAGWALLAVVLTGTARAVGEAGGIGEVRTLLSDTSYGTALIVKVAIAAGLIALGAINRRRSIPRLGNDGTLLRRVVAIELVGSLGVFGLTGTLTSLDPNATGSPALRREPPSIEASGADFATTIRVTLTASPGTAGPNTFEARVVGYDYGAPIAADEVALTLGPIGRSEIERVTLPLEPAGADGSGAPAAWTGTGTQLSLAGAWEVVVQVRSGARTTEVPLVLVTRAPPAPSVVTRQAGLPEIETFTVSAGDQLAVYLDPGTAGANELHVTAFDPQGDELALSGLVVVADAPGGERAVLESTRLTAGHFSAPAEVDPGGWRFHVVATTEGGTVLQATHDQEVEP